MILSGEISERVTRIFGEEGVTWLGNLPEVIGRLSSEWQLEEIGEPFPGSRASFVAPVIGRRGQRLVLKISPATGWFRHECDALGHWHGRGAVQVYRSSLADGAMLLQSAEPGQALREVADAPGEAATAFAATAADLRDRAWPAPELPSITTWLERLGADGPGRLRAQSAKAIEVGQELLGAMDETVVLHGDLHHGNVLEHRGGWVAVDPKGLLGPREAEPAAFLRNPRRLILAHPDPIALTLERVSVICRKLEYDPRVVLGWAYVLAVVAATWSVEDGEGDAETDRWLRCAEVMLEARQV